MSLLGSVLNPILNPIREVAGKVMTNGVQVPPQLAQKRLKICNVCPYLLKTTRNCKKCASWTQK